MHIENALYKYKFIIIYESGSVSTRLVAAKSRVAPLTTKKYSSFRTVGGSPGTKTY